MASPAPPHPTAPQAGSDPLLQLVFDHAGEGIGVFDAGLCLQAWNGRFLALTRLDPGQVQRGAPLQALLDALVSADGSGRLEAAQALQRLAPLCDGPACVVAHTRPDGSALELRSSTATGHTRLLFCADISERHQVQRRLSERERMLALLNERNEQGLWYVDNALRTIDANPAMCRLLGWTLPEMLGRTIYDFVDEANARVFRARISQRAKDAADGYEVTLLRRDGSSIHCFNDAKPLFDAQGHKIGAVGMFSDISPLKKAEQQVRQTGELLAQKSRVLEVTLQSLSQGVLSIDAQGRVNAYNQRFLDLLQIPEALMRTRPTLQAVRDFQMAQGHIDFDPMTVGLEAWRLRPARYQRLTREGLVLEVQTHHASDGSLVRTYTDVTGAVRAQRALEESESRFRSMANAAPAFIWLSDAAGQPKWFNQRWLDRTQRSMDAELRLGWPTRLHPDDLAHCRQVFQQAASRNLAYQVEYRLHPDGGSQVWVADHGIPRFTHDGHFDGYVVYGWDITDRKSAAVALIAAKDEAERANRAKSEFLSRMSHELRTPLNAVLGFGQLMAHDERDKLSPLQRSRLQELMRGGRHLLRLINDVLDLSRIEAGALHLALAAVPLNGVVQDCLHLVQAAAAQRGISLDVRPGPPEPCHVLADPTRLKQVLLNLLSNAIKYNSDGGQVGLRWQRVMPGEGDADGSACDLVRIEVWDTGPGLSPQQQARLFLAFERLGAEHSDVEGAGIGLALSQWLVHLMQGRIGVRSAPGQGSVFWVTLSLAPAGASTLAQEPAAADAPAPVSGKPHTVLYIEDNEVNQLLMDGMLGQRPALRLVMASHPEAGLALALRECPDLVLLDIQLPGIDGFEVLRRLREDPRTQQLPVVAVSANAMPADRARAASAGFDDYITKPIDMACLLAVVDRLLGD